MDYRQDVVIQHVAASRDESGGGRRLPGPLSPDKRDCFGPSGHGTAMQKRRSSQLKHCRHDRPKQREADKLPIHGERIDNDLAILVHPESTGVRPGEIGAGSIKSDQSRFVGGQRSTNRTQPDRHVNRGGVIPGGQFRQLEFRPDMQPVGPVICHLPNGQPKSAIGR
jgi:hypothetical protein